MKISRSTDENGEVVYWKTPYNHDTLAENERTQFIPTGEKLTQDSFKDEQDINKIVERVLRTGQMPDIQLPPQYGDLTTADDFHAMQNKLAETKGLFYKLPAAIRASYQNDAGAWLEHVNQAVASGDVEPLREMGLDLASYDLAQAKIKDAQDEARLTEREAKRKATSDPGATKTGDTPPKT